MEEQKFETKKLKLVLIVVSVIALLSVVFSINLYKKLQNIENPEAIAKEEVDSTVKAVAKLMVLPQGETPTAATVSDPTKLKDQPFFANSISGDKVLIYTNAHKAILYRPSINKIIEVAPTGGNVQ